MLLAAGLFGAALLLLLAAPLELRFQVHGVAPWRGELAVRAWFGLWRGRISFPLAGRPAGPPAAAARRRAASGAGSLPALWRRPALRRLVARRLRQLLAGLHWRELRLAVRLGLDDPADTGRLWAVLGPVGAGLAGLPQACVSVEPDFTGARLDFDAGGRVVLVPARLLWPLLRLATVLGLALGLALARQRLGGGGPR